MATGSPNNMLTSGFCAYPSIGSHAYCREKGHKCSCVCHTDPSAVTDLQPEPEDDEVEFAAGEEVSIQAQSESSGEGQGT